MTERPALDADGFLLNAEGISKHYQGVTALCRSQQLRFYQRFGLMPIASNALHIEQRARGDYWVLSAQWRQILAALQQPDHATVGHLVQKPLACHPLQL